MLKTRPFVLAVIMPSLNSVKGHLQDQLHETSFNPLCPPILGDVGKRRGASPSARPTHGTGERSELARGAGGHRRGTARRASHSLQPGLGEQNLSLDGRGQVRVNRPSITPRVPFWQ